MAELPNLKPSSLIKQTSDTLTDFIVKGGTKPGDYLPSEQALCKKLGVGRSTLREGIKVLESKGLVRRLHGVGVQVVEESQKAATDMLQLLLRRQGASIGELIEARNLLEVKAVEFAAERATPEDLTVIRRALRAMQSKGTTPGEYVQADLEFHLAIARATHNNVLALVVETIRPLLQDAIIATLKVDSRPELRRRYHEKILGAMEKKDSKQAAVAMAEHLRGTQEMLQQVESQKSRKRRRRTLAE